MQRRRRLATRGARAPRRRALRLLLPLLLAASAACETSATAEPCPGLVQGTFRLVGELVEGVQCAAAAGGSPTIDLEVTLSYTEDGGAAVCLARPLAPPMVGSRDGDRVEVSAPRRAVPVPGCACAVDVVEEIAGTAVRGTSGLEGFSGELTSSLTPADVAASCAPAGEEEACVAPCTVRWTLSSG